MPELAEVRFLERNLQKELVGKGIYAVQVLHPKVLDVGKATLQECQAILVKELMPDLPHTDLGKPLFARSVESIGRKGKYLLINLEPDKTLLTHLSFTGWYIPEWAEEKSPRRFLHPMDPDRHTRMKFVTSAGNLFLTDPRALSRTRIFRNEEDALQSKFLKNIGPDADTQEAAIKLHKVIPTTRRRIRDLLMDQSVIGGIGNYLVAEILNRAGIHGAEPANSLSSLKVGVLIGTIKVVILMAEQNDNHDWWRVFRRKETPEGYPVTRENWNGRGHYCCYHDQPKPGINSGGS